MHIRYKSNCICTIYLKFTLALYKIISLHKTFQAKTTCIQYINACYCSTTMTTHLHHQCKIGCVLEMKGTWRNVCMSTLAWMEELSIPWQCLSLHFGMIAFDWRIPLDYNGHSNMNQSAVTAQNPNSTFLLSVTVLLWAVLEQKTCQCCCRAFSNNLFENIELSFPPFILLEESGLWNICSFRKWLWYIFNSEYLFEPLKQQANFFLFSCWKHMFVFHVQDDLETSDMQE